MNDQRDNDHRIAARRRLLKSLVASGGVYATGKFLPHDWKRPVVNSVTLPAHAESSPPESPNGLIFSTGDEVGPVFGPGPAPTDSGFGDPLLDFFIGSADASISCINVSTKFDLTFAFDDNSSRVDICAEVAQSPGGGFVNALVSSLNSDNSINNAAAGAVSLSNMQWSSGANQVTGFISVNMCPAEFFTADLVPGPFVCNEGNLSAFMDLSSPHPEPV